MDQSILNSPVEKLPFSKNFIEICKIEGFESISQIIDLSPHDLLKKHEVNIEWIEELSVFMSLKKMHHLFQKLN